MFSHQIEPHTAKLSFSIVLKHLYRNWPKNCHLSQNSFYLNKLNTHLCFSNQNEQYTAKRSLFVVLKHFYRNWQKKLLFMSKKCFSYQIKPHSATLSFSFEAFFTEIDKKLPYMSKSVFSSNWATYSLTTLFDCIEAFLQKLIKKTCHLEQKSVFLIKLSHIQLY